MSKNIKNRLRDIYRNIEDKNRIEIIKEYKNKGFLETKIHKKYEQYQTEHTFYEDGKTEWFKLTDKHIKEIDYLLSKS